MSETHVTRRSTRDRSDPLVRIPKLGIILAIIGIAVIVVWGFVVKHDASLTALDIWLNRLHVAAFDWLALAIALVFSPPGAVIVGVLFFVIVAWLTRSVPIGLGAAVAVGLGWASSYVVKLLVHRPRPVWSLMPYHLGKIETDASFPSGHTTFVATLAVVTVLLLWRSRYRTLAIVLGAIAVVLVALSRMYIGVHDLNDVAAATLYGVCGGMLAFAFVRWLLVKLGWYGPRVQSISRIG